MLNALQDLKQLDVMVALGMHPPLTDADLNKLIGIRSEERDGTLKHMRLLNYEWDSGSFRGAS